MSDFIGLVIVFVGMVILVALITALPVMWLWNAIMPDIFGLTTITFWQAVCLSILSSILFKSNTNVKTNT
jgi:hypothetical protein